MGQRHRGPRPGEIRTPPGNIPPRRQIREIARAVVLPEAFPTEIRQWVSPEALLDRQSRGGLAGKDPATREAWSQRVTSPAGRQGIGRYSGALRCVTVRPAVPYCFHEYDGPGATMMLDTTTLRAAFGVITLTLLVLFYLVTFRHTRVRSTVPGGARRSACSFSEPLRFFLTEPRSRYGRTRWETPCWLPALRVSGPPPVL
jgi:hypothetical protein